MKPHVDIQSQKQERKTRSSSTSNPSGETVRPQQAPSGPQERVEVAPWVCLVSCPPSSPAEWFSFFGPGWMSGSSCRLHERHLPSSQWALRIAGSQGDTLKTDANSFFEDLFSWVQARRQEAMALPAAHRLVLPRSRSKTRNPRGTGESTEPGLRRHPSPRLCTAASWEAPPLSVKQWKCDWVPP